MRWLTKLRDIPPMIRPAWEMAGSLDLTAREENGVFRVWVDGEELTDRLRDPGTDKAVKILAMHRPVREVLVRIQRELAKDGGIVMEGRDITSVVLPDAEVKVFLTADVEERARRRWQELQDKGVEMTFEGSGRTRRAGPQSTKAGVAGWSCFDRPR